MIDYFGADLARRVRAERGPAKVVTAGAKSTSTTLIS